MGRFFEVLWTILLVIMVIMLVALVIENRSLWNTMVLIAEIWVLVLLIGLVLSLIFTILGWMRDAREVKQADERYENYRSWLRERLQKGKRV